jgi:transcriptional regulator with XRE-family HTH domain
MNTTETRKRKNRLIDVSRIRELCDDKNYSIAELGRRIGLDERQKINARLQNNNTITADELFLIADELDVSVDDLRLKK